MIFPNKVNTCHDSEFWEKSLAVGHGKVIFHEKSSAKIENVMVSPKNFTVGSPVTSDQAPLQIFGLIRGYCRPNKEPLQGPLVQFIRFTSAVASLVRDCFC